jgi:hypothetical protein
MSITLPTNDAGNGVEDGESGGCSDRRPDEQGKKQNRDYQSEDALQDAGANCDSTHGDIMTYPVE